MPRAHEKRSDEAYDRLFEALDATGLSILKLAQEIGCTRSAIYQWRDKKTWPKAVYVVQIARISGKSPEWIERGVDGPNLDASTAAILYYWGRMPDDKKDDALKIIKAIVDD